MLHRLDYPLSQVLGRLGIHLAYTPIATYTEDLLVAKAASATGTKWFQQVRIATSRGDFYLDAGALIRSGYAIGLECDGQGHHEPVRDFCRDALILETGRVQRIYRLPDWAIRDDINRCLFLLGRRERGLIEESRLKILEAIVSGQKRDRRIEIVCADARADSIKQLLAFARENPSLSFTRLVEHFRQRMTHANTDQR